MDKVCAKCQSPDNPFPKVGRVCRPCLNRYKAEHYQQNKDQYQARNRQDTGEKNARRRQRYASDPEYAAKIKGRVRNYQKANPDKIREKHLSATYGISIAEYEDLLKQQDGRCAVCDGGPTKSRSNLSVDHDHKTGAVRGLLCNLCNILIGNAKDDPALLDRAKAYLMRAKQ